MSGLSNSILSVGMAALAALNSVPCPLVPPRVTNNTSLSNSLLFFSSSLLLDFSTFDLLLIQYHCPCQIFDSIKNITPSFSQLSTFLESPATDLELRLKQLIEPRPAQSISSFEALHQHTFSIHQALRDLNYQRPKPLRPPPPIIASLIHRPLSLSSSCRSIGLHTFILQEDLRSLGLSSSTTFCHSLCTGSVHQSNSRSQHRCYPHNPHQLFSKISSTLRSDTSL